eukprot:GFKZ01003704.1.p1 GENE.GFKZ01003704.1~~GFKZ01003704.1.p1  ORF type:complete len:953 (+),score=119.93 GFKZ01003704.1:202-3060(+)
MRIIGKKSSLSAIDDYEESAVFLKEWAPPIQSLIAAIKENIEAWKNLYSSCYKIESAAAQVYAAEDVDGLACLKAFGDGHKSINPGPPQGSPVILATRDVSEAVEQLTTILTKIKRAEEMQRKLTILAKRYQVKESQLKGLLAKEAKNRATPAKVSRAEMSIRETANSLNGLADQLYDNLEEIDSHRLRVTDTAVRALIHVQHLHYDANPSRQAKAKSIALKIGNRSVPRDTNRCMKQRQPPHVSAAPHKQPKSPSASSSSHASLPANSSGSFVPGAQSLDQLQIEFPHQPDQLGHHPNSAAPAFSSTIPNPGNSQGSTTALHDPHFQEPFTPPSRTSIAPTFMHAPLASAEAVNPPYVPSVSPNNSQSAMSTPSGSSDWSAACPQPSNRIPSSGPHQHAYQSPVQFSQQPPMIPTVQPMTQPTMQPTSQPAMQPMSQSTTQPTAQPMMQPTTQPTIQPVPLQVPTSVTPAVQPQVQPQAQPPVQPPVQPPLQPPQELSPPQSNQALQQPPTPAPMEPSAQPPSQPPSQQEASSPQTPPEQLSEKPELQKPPPQPSPGEQSEVGQPPVQGQPQVDQQQRQYSPSNTGGKLQQQPVGQPLQQPTQDPHQPHLQQVEQQSRQLVQQPSQQLVSQTSQQLGQQQPQHMIRQQSYPLVAQQSQQQPQPQPLVQTAANTTPQTAAQSLSQIATQPSMPAPGQPPAQELAQTLAQDIVQMPQPGNSSSSDQFANLQQATVQQPAQVPLQSHQFQNQVHLGPQPVTQSQQVMQVQANHSAPGPYVPHARMQGSQPQWGTTATARVPSQMYFPTPSQQPKPLIPSTTSLFQPEMYRPTPPLQAPTTQAQGPYFTQTQATPLSRQNSYQASVGSSQEMYLPGPQAYNGQPQMPSQIGHMQAGHPAMHLSGPRTPWIEPTAPLATPYANQAVAQAGLRQDSVPRDMQLPSNMYQVAHSKPPQ